MMRGRRLAAIGASGLGALAVAAAALAQTSGGAYELSWRAFAGGGKSTGGAYSEQGAIGQALAKTSSGGSYSRSCLIWM